MTILIILIIIGIVCCLMAYNNYSNSYELWITGVVICPIIVAILGISIITSQYGTLQKISEFKEAKATLERGRTSEEISIYEGAAIYTKIMESNKWLAGQKYINSTIFDIWVPDEIESLEMIE